MQYLDVTDDPQARARLRRADKTADALLALGFRPLGLLETVGSVAVVSEVFASPDGRCFAEPEVFGRGKEIVYLRSILQDGTIVDTTGRAPVPVWLLPPPRLHAPASGQHVQRVGDGTPGQLWAAHRDLLGRLETTHGPVAAADDLARYRVLCDRSWGLSHFRMLVYLPLLLLLFGAALAVPLDFDSATLRLVLRAALQIGAFAASSLLTMVLAPVIVRRRTVPLAELERR